MRVGEVKRKTNETDVTVQVGLDGTGNSKIATGIGFLDHILTLFSRHSLIDLTLTARGDLEVDDHHTVEDIGICMGQALAQALGEKRGISRYGFFILPMDESLAQAAVDFSGRPYLVFDARFDREMVGDLSTELVREFFYAVSVNAKMNINMRVTGENTHHKIEALFKAFARAVRTAVAIDGRAKDEIPSTKGVI